MKMDRSAFRMGSHREAEDNRAYWADKSLSDRLDAANYLNSVAFNFDKSNPPKLDRSFFNMRKHSA